MPQQLMRKAGMTSAPDRPAGADPHLALLERVDTLLSTLARMVLEGASIDEIAGEVTRMLDVGVVVTSTDGRERGASITPRSRSQLVDAGLVDPSGRFRVERLRASHDAAAAADGGAPFRDGEVRLVQVAAARADLVRLICVSPERPLSPDDVQALERAATVVALLVTQQRAVAAVENKYRGDFLRDVFLGRAGDDAFVIDHARGLGWDLARPTVVLSAEVDPPAPGEDAPAHVRREWQDRFSAAWRLVCETGGRAIPAVDFSTEVVALVPVPDRLDDQERDRSLRALVAQLVADVSGDRGGGRRPFSVGVSRPVGEPAGLPAAYNQARRAATVGRRISGGNATTWFDDLGLHRLIALVTDDAELQAFADDVLGPLAGDTAEAADLRTTLQVLLDTNLNVAEAARRQFFHYNTMRYRVGKLERLLGPFTGDPHLRLNVAVALQVLDFRG
jgi:PucR family transcriptional regulator, purine catabolism regulatory protein